MFQFFRKHLFPLPQARLSDLLKYIRNIGAEDQDDDESIQDLCEPKYEEAKGVKTWEMLVKASIKIMNGK